MIWKLIYLTVTKPEISFDIGLLNQFMHEPEEIYWKVAIRILSYIKSSLRKELLYKKQNRIHIYATQMLDILKIEVKKVLY